MTNLVASGVAQTGEQRGELAADSGSGVLLEDDLVEGSSRSDLGKSQVSDNRSARISNRIRSHPGLVAHQSLRGGVDLGAVRQC